MGKFKDWIMGAGGTAAVAKVMGKSQKAVQHWMRGHSNPRLKDANRIIKLSKGKLSLQDILKAGK